MAPTLVSFALASLGDSPVRLLDVWRLPERISGRDREQKLLSLATRTVDDWAEEGATDIRHSPKLVAGDAAFVSVEDVVTFKAGNAPRASAMRYRADQDGTVFRVSASAAPDWSTQQLVDHCDAVMGSLHRVDSGSSTESPTAARPWWRPW